MESDYVYNERLKALAGLMHNLAVASIVTGVVVPLFAANSGNDPQLTYIYTVPIGSALALAFGWLGQIILKDLRG